MKDNISDMLTRIRNGQKAHLLEVPLFWPTPNKCIDLLKVFHDQGFIRGFKKVILNDKKIIYVLLKYTEFQKPRIKKIERVSTAGKRIYSKSKSFWKINNGKGIFIISTPRGLLTNTKACFQNIGGEIICYIE